jgi:hypothetical protein
MRKFAVLLTAIALAAVVTSAPRAAGKAPARPPNYTLADSLTFKDRNADSTTGTPADAIRSDAGVPYTSTLQIFTGGSGDLTYGLPSNRYISAAATGSVAGSGNLLAVLVTGFVPVNQTVHCTTGAVLNIYGVTGSDEARTASFGCTGKTSGDLIQFGEHGSDGANLYSTQVLVSRTSASPLTWEVTTDGTMTPSAAQAVYVTQISKKATGFAATYSMPFKFTVVCSNCP